MAVRRGERPGCLAALVTPRREIVLQLRDDRPGIRWPGYWSLLGGGLEPGESPLDGVLREIREEAGIVPERIEEVRVEPWEAGKRPPHVFLGSWDGDESRLVPGEGQAVRLVPLGELPGKMPPHVRHYLWQLGLGAAA
ncbi:NUDIX domain-containing protein [Streptomyces sp. NPDC005435]|uniref:NUDIX domain-containing protein n=1 Tax=Streptomyces sp. NPDC005435 TaxID=3154464 RepID=UPI00345701EC